MSEKGATLERENAEILAPYRKPFKFSHNCPSFEEAKKVIPPHCFKRSLVRSMFHAILSVVWAASFGIFAYRVMPTISWNPLVIMLWLVYAFIEGTLLTGCWVISHECGHGAFCDNKYLQDAVGFILHSALLVPYYSWQRSHAVHHGHTNHMTEGETHVPNKANEFYGGGIQLAIHDSLGDTLFGVFNLFNHIVIGWPVYLMFGTTGGPARGMSNHFIPWNDSLFPGKWKTKVIFSDLGVFAMLSILYLWARLEGSWTPVLCFYFLPYIVANGWLVLYTWLQHTDVDIPHYEASEWTWVKGAFATVDRPYGAIINFLHHGIGSTHVAHHLFSYMPHYNAWEATRALQKAFPEFYMYDPTPIIPTMWRVARKCVAVVREEDTKRWVYISTRNQIR